MGKEWPNVAAKALLWQDLCVGRRQMAAPEEMDQTWSAFFDLVTVEGCSCWPQHHGQGCCCLALSWWVGLSVCHQFWVTGRQGLLGQWLQYQGPLATDHNLPPQGHISPPGREEVLELPSTFSGCLIQPQIIVTNLSEAHLFLIISLNPKVLQLREFGKFSCQRICNNHSNPWYLQSFLFQTETQTNMTVVARTPWNCSWVLFTECQALSLSYFV